MNEKSNLNSNCEYCGWKFPHEFQNKLENNGETIPCENCGTEILLENNYLHNNAEPNSENDTEKENLSQLYDKFQKENNPIARVVFDAQFPDSFKDNLKIVIARLLYPHLRAFKHRKKSEISQEIVDGLFQKINPIMDQKVDEIFLHNLHELESTDFYKWLRLLQDKINGHDGFRKDFIIYLRWMIQEVYTIFTQLWTKNELPKFNRIIRDDLRAFESMLITLDTRTSQEEIFDEFLNYLHNIEPVKQYVDEFNTSGNWMKNFRPTKTFITFLHEKRTRLTRQSRNSENNTPQIRNQIDNISKFISLANDIRQNDNLNKVIKAKIFENPSKYNAYDIAEWFLLSDTSTRNQLNRILTKEEYEQYVRTQTHVSIDTIKKIAAKKGGKCHTKSLKNAKSEVHLECAEGHHFHTTFNSVVYTNSWCPDCNNYVSEIICRQYFERIFKRPFLKSYPEWLINENGNQMELDGYNKELRLAFEYQGIQHRKIAFGKTEQELKDIQREDTLKLKLCEEHGVTLLQIPDDELVPYDKMQEYIEQEYTKLTGKMLKNIPRYDYKEFVIHENEHAKKFREYVEKKGGSVITPYFAAKKKVTLMCENGHQWITTPNSIYQGNWCPECAGNMKETAEFFQKIGKLFNCELISEYVNAKTPIKYKCQKGHNFTRRPYWLKRVYSEIEILCPKCNTEVFAEKFREFVRKKGGQLVTPYKGRFKPITLKCSKNHNFRTTPGAVYQGRWCKVCAEETNPNTKRLLNAKRQFLQMIGSLQYRLISDYENNLKTVKIKCRNQHQFTITPKYFKRLVKQNIEPCSKCRKGN